MSNAWTPGLLTLLPTPPRKVVLLRASRIGDFLCAIPAFRALRMALPNAEITMITLPLLRDICVRIPYLDRYVAFPGFPGIAEQFFDAQRTIRFFQAMQAEQFDLAIQMQGTGVNSNPFTLLLGAQATAGFVRLHDSPGLLDAALPYPQVHEVRCVLALTTFLGVPPQGEEIEFPFWPSDHREAQALLAEAKPPLIGLHPSARDATRRWALDRFAQVGIQLRQRYGGTIVLIGEIEEQSIGNVLAEKIGQPCLNLFGKTTLPTVGAILARMAVFVTNDTGPAHIAYALKVPTITIFGSGNPATNGPLQAGPFRLMAHKVSCSACGYAACPPGYVCEEGITVQEVMQAAQEIIRIEEK